MIFRVLKSNNVFLSSSTVIMFFVSGTHIIKGCNKHACKHMKLTCEMFRIKYNFDLNVIEFRLGERRNR